MIMLWHFGFYQERYLHQVHSLYWKSEEIFLQLGAELDVCPRPHSDQNCPSFVPMWDREAGGWGGGLIYSIFAAIGLLLFWKENWILLNIQIFFVLINSEKMSYLYFWRVKIYYQCPCIQPLKYHCSSSRLAEKLPAMALFSAVEWGELSRWEMFICKPCNSHLIDCLKPSSIHKSE